MKPEPITESPTPEPELDLVMPTSLYFVFGLPLVAMVLYFAMLFRDPGRHRREVALRRAEREAAAEAEAKE